MISKDDVKLSGEFARIAVNVNDVWSSITVQQNNLNVAHELIARFWKQLDERLKKLEAPKGPSEGSLVEPLHSPEFRRS